MVRPYRNPVSTASPSYCSCHGLRVSAFRGLPLSFTQDINKNRRLGEFPGQIPSRTLQQKARPTT